MEPYGALMEPYGALMEPYGAISSQGKSPRIPFLFGDAREELFWLTLALSGLDITLGNPIGNPGILASLGTRLETHGAILGLF